jgi:hypothetical protein
VSGIGNQTFPESNVEALYQIATGEGGTFRSGGGEYVMPHWEGDCLDMGWGAPCFRSEAMAVVIHFTDACAHNGPPGDAFECSDYTGIDPSPHTWEEAIARMNDRGVRFIGINSLTGYECEADPTPRGTAPCHYMHQTGIATRTVDRDGLPLVFDMDVDAPTSDLVDTVAAAVERLAFEVPGDITTRLADGPDFGSEAEVDASRFIKSRRPACSAIPPAASCWTAPEGVPHEEAVAATDESGFFSVIPGTIVTFRITFRNDFVPPLARSQVFVAFIDVTSGGTSRLDRRQVFIVVPADAGTIE